MIDVLYNCTVKTYPDGHKQYHYFARAREYDYTVEDDTEEKKDGSSVLRKEVDNNKRALSKVYDLAQSNVWDWFVTYTFNSEVVDRYDYTACLGALKLHLRYLRDHGCMWLIVPEQHKDGAYHFHGLVAGDLPVSYGLTAIDGTDVFNVHGYSAGFSTATRIRDTKRASTYICKYMTKEISVPKGQRRYLASRSLQRPTECKIELPPDKLDALVDSARYVKVCPCYFGDMMLIEE